MELIFAAQQVGVLCKAIRGSLKFCVAISYK
jgi:hypothetical protein